MYVSSSPVSNFAMNAEVRLGGQGKDGSGNYHTHPVNPDLPGICRSSTFPAASAGEVESEVSIGSDLRACLLDTTNF